VRLWSGQWTADRLDARLTTTAGVGGLVAEDLVGLGLRRNPRRAHLLVSRVLGKHVPTDPRLVHGAARLLGALVADRLTGVTGDLPADGARAADGGALVAAALRGEPTASSDLLAALDAQLPSAPVEALVLGYAETATGLGHSVADQLRAPYLHSTRRPVPGVAPVGAFEESHSHATSHLLLPADPALLAGPRPLVLVDDELSTGATVMDTIRAVQAIAPRPRYVVAALVDLRSAADRAALAAFAAEAGVEVEVVALVSGEVALPADALTRGAALVERHGRSAAEPRPVAADVRPVRAWPDGVRDGGRHGFPDGERPAFDAAVAAVARQLRPGLPGAAGERLLVLGTEELMYLPTRLAAELAALLAGDGVEVLVSSTTRSPVVPVDEPGCAIRTALTFPASDDPADGPGPRYAYNVAPPTGGRPFDAVLLVVDDAHTPVADGLEARLAAVTAGPVTVLTVPSSRPGTR
jgi:adenine/guanine phosphoribosyltransferase-like PRPP-binding protein